MLRGRRLQAPFYGVRVAAGAADSLIGRCAALAARYPNAAFSHRTAALFHQLPLPPDAARPEAGGATISGTGRPQSGVALQGGLDVMVTAGRQWLARPDLSYPSLRIAVEYEGGTTAPTVANGARTSAGDACWRMPGGWSSR
jgi:hypothetical protein